MEVTSRDNHQRSRARGLGRLLIVMGAAGLMLGVVKPMFSGRGQAPGGAVPQGSHGKNWAQALGTLLLVAGVISLILAVVFYFVDPLAGDRMLPSPVALAVTSETESPTPVAAVETPEPAPATVVTPSPTPAALAALPTGTAAPTLEPTPTPIPLKPGVPVRMIVPAINLDSKVKEIGTYWEKGQLLWETIPFLVGHYRTTAQVGEKGNAVFAGHVTSRNAGNVFADLYKIRLGDEIRVFSDEDEYTYEVTSVKLVLPTETSVMDPTPDPTITLITCAGEWVPAERNYTHRLIVSAKLKR